MRRFILCVPIMIAATVAVAAPKKAVRDAFAGIKAEFEDATKKGKAEVKAKCKVDIAAVADLAACAESDTDAVWNYKHSVSAAYASFVTYCSDAASAGEVKKSGIKTLKFTCGKDSAVKRAGGDLIVVVTKDYPFAGDAEVHKILDK